MTDLERQKLENAKLDWRKTMKNYYGDSWTKRRSSRMRNDGRRRMNIPE